jgi:hypothetical protein
MKSWLEMSWLKQKIKSNLLDFNSNNEHLIFEIIRSLEIYLKTMFKETISIMQMHTKYSKEYNNFIEKLYKEKYKYFVIEVLFENFNAVLYIETISFNKIVEKNMLGVIFGESEVKKVMEELDKYSKNTRNQFAHGVNETVKLENFNENLHEVILTTCMYIDELEILWIRNLENILNNFDIFGD